MFGVPPCRLEPIILLEQGVGDVVLDCEFYGNEVV